MTRLHKTEPLFVGRQGELKRFGEILASPRGQAVLVVGPQGMGKTLLVNRMARMAQEHPDLACDHVRFEVTDSDEPDAVMELMIDRAFDAAGLEESSVGGGERRTRQYLALIKLLPKGDAIGDLILSLRRDPKKNARQQLGEKLECISRRMKENARAIFVIDPEKYMAPRSADAWRLVVDNLPNRIIFLFAQRPDDVLATSAEFGALSNVERIPDGPLDVLDERAVDDLVQAWAADLAGKSQSHQYRPDVHRDEEAAMALARYKGHPYAVAAALGLLADGVAVADLPADPTATGVAGAQWRRLCDEHKENAVRLFEAYAILEVAVPDPVVETVSGVDGTVRKALIANAFVDGLLRPEPDGTRIYHSLLADHIHEQVSETTAKAYHTRAIEVYRLRLTAETKPDALAAVRLPEHVLEIEGPKAFIISFGSECVQPLINLGLLDAAEGMARRVAEHYPSPGSDLEAIIDCILGNIFLTRGDLGEAERMQRMSLAINEKSGRLDGIAGDYANLGVILYMRGQLDEAERMQRKSLEINEKLGQLEGMANAYGNLANIYETRDNLDEAEKMQRKSLAINQQLGRLEGIANAYATLGSIYQARDDLDEAEKMQRKSLAINEQLGQLRGMAAAYNRLGTIFETRDELDEAEQMQRKSLELGEGFGGLREIGNALINLGTIFHRRGELDEAEKTYRKYLEIDERHGRPAVMALACGRLGIIYEVQGELDAAEKMYRKSLEIEKKLGRLEGMADDYGKLGIVFAKRGDLDEGDKMQRKSLEINKKLGRLEGIARNYGNLGNTFALRGDLDEAEEMNCKGLEIDERLGRLEGMANHYCNLGAILEMRGDMDEARKLWTKARDLYTEIGMPHMVEEMQGWLDELPDAGEDRS